MKKAIIGFLSIIIILGGSIFVGYNIANNQSQEITVEVLQDDNEKTKMETDKVVEVPEGYEEILQIMKEYKLPEEGIEKKAGSSISYSNGYTFDKNTKIAIGREYKPEDGPPKPSEGQFLGVIIGFISDIDYQHPWNYSIVSDDITEKLGRLSESKIYSEKYKPIEVWIDETIHNLEQSRELMDTDNASSEEFYIKACKDINDFNKVIKIHVQEQKNPKS